MRAGPLAGGTAMVISTKVTFCRLRNGPSAGWVDHDCPPSGLIPDIDHPYVVVRTTVGAGAATNTGNVIDHDLAVAFTAMYRAGRAAQHADRVLTVHAGVGHHEVVVNLAVANEARVVVMSRGTGAHTIVTTSTTVKVDHHGSGTVDEAVFHQELHHVGPSIVDATSPVTGDEARFRSLLAAPLIGSSVQLFAKDLARKGAGLPVVHQSWVEYFFEGASWNTDQIRVARSSQGCL